jgi:glutaredoxin
MKLVILESPYAGNIAYNTEYARECLKDSLNRGEAPIVSHLLYTQVLDDNIPEQRQLGIEAGLAWRKVAEKSVVYIDYGISKGMQYGINLAIKENITIEYRKIRENKMYTVWTKDNCSYCYKAKELLKKHNIPFEERVIGKDWTKEDLLKIAPHAKTVPQIFLNDIYIGNYEELLIYLEDYSNNGK